MYSKTNQKKLEKIIKKYGLTQKSPYSQSYYSDGLITWGSKPEGSYRLSDHWNFWSRGEQHCKTACGTQQGWYVGVYNNGVYTLIEKVFTDEEMALEDRCFKRYLDKQRKLEEAIKRGIELVVNYKVSTKSGRYFNTQEYTEKCLVKGCWAYTSHGRKRVFEIVEAI